MAPAVAGDGSEEIFSPANIGFLAVIFTYVGVDFLLPQIHGTQR